MFLVESQPMTDEERREKKEKERAECPFCRFMREGPCGSEFERWEACLDEHENDDYPKLCSGQTVRYNTPWLSVFIFIFAILDFIDRMYGEP